ncbi:MAG: SDR family NAD(P)-dependent oxidoreductase [Pseudomonadota bacterium]
MIVFTATPESGAVWITGASEGIGKAVAEQMAADGFTVYASARSEDKLKKIAEDFSGSGKILPIPLDVTDRAACKACIETIIQESGKLAVVILNAGTFAPIRGKDLKFEDFELTLDVNVYGVLNGLIPAVEAMKDAGQGQVAIVSSVAGYGGLPKNAGYGISKAGLINMAESLKFDFDKMNIKLQIITPGFIDTPLTKKNDFPMPFLMDVDAAAERVVSGLKTNAFEITFPRRFTYMLKFLNLWCYPVYFWLVKRGTGSG